ncbi:MAG: TadE/TadG family type IV pilus assembly protein [Bryobacterales bacterium]
MVEFALTALLLFILAFGAFEIGRAIWTFSTISYAAKEGVRYAMIHGADNAGVSANGNAFTQTDVESQIEDVVKSAAPGLDPAALIIHTTWTPNNIPGSKVKVSVEYPIQIMFNPLTPQMPAPGIKTQYEMIVTN